MEFHDLRDLSKKQLYQCALLLHQEIPTGWKNIEEAQNEITEQLESDGYFYALIDQGQLFGWGGILPHYSGHVYEIHPMVIDKKHQNKGFGGLLIKHLEDKAKFLGGLTIYAASDDEFDDRKSSLRDTDGYDNIYDKMKHFDPKGHPARFYIKYGYQLIGIMPDANGRGKHDLILSKKL
ncbi:MAG: GNAT family N-acetyltransferase [Tenericutes bacterium]|nr:GNAT family N-acetyltransferase [Mycoplasmatota bacterium]